MESDLFVVSSLNMLPACYYGESGSDADAELSDVDSEKAYGSWLAADRPLSLSQKI